MGWVWDWFREGLGCVQGRFRAGAGWLRVYPVLLAAVDPVLCQRMIVSPAKDSPKTKP